MLHAREDYNRIQDPEGKIPEGEPVFLLRAQDQVAAEVVRFWARLHELQGGDPGMVLVAREQADRMDAWPWKKRADM
ncbi:MAG: hypothetical protein Q8R92_01705 [Deltaproteobacteria bacterium]|nr:hypothetical protein [Deltaproteobacteria bacterium]